MSRPPAAREASPPRSTDRLHGGCRGLVAGNIAIVKTMDNVLDLIHDGVPAAYPAWAAPSWTKSCKTQQAPPKLPTRAAAS